MDQSAEGREGTPFEMTIEAGKVREFARATKSTNPEYRQDDSVIPPTFLAAAAFWQTETSSPSRGIPINLERMLHGGQEFIFHGEPPESVTTSRDICALGKFGKSKDAVAA